MKSFLLIAALVSGYGEKGQAPAAVKGQAPVVTKGQAPAPVKGQAPAAKGSVTKVTTVETVEVSDVVVVGRKRLIRGRFAAPASCPNCANGTCGN